MTIAEPATQHSELILHIPLSSIATSPFNPRKAFDGIDELAASIAEQGVLENLVVRKTTKADRYELVAGERRLRALKQLKRETAPCRVIGADDGQAMAAQIVENLQRADITPLEEAEAFKRLQDQDAKKWTAATIAKAIGKTDRFVQQRLAIANNLAPDLKKKLASAEISVEVARTLAAVPKELQAKLKAGWGVRQNDARRVRDDLLKEVVPVSAAAFDVGRYQGAMIEDGDKRYFADVAQFDKLQNAAAQSLVEQLRKGLWKSAKLVDRDDAFQYCWGDTLQRVYSWESKTKSVGKAKVGVEKLTAIVWIDDGKLKQATGVVPAGLVEKRHSSSNGGMNRETAAQRRSRLDFNTRLIKACADKADTGARVLLTAFVGTYGARTTYDGNAVNKSVDLFLPEPLAKLVKGGSYGDGGPKAWEVVNTMKLADVHRAIAGYAALAFLWDSHDKKPKGVTATLGQLLRIKPQQINPPGKAKVEAKSGKAKKKGGRK